VPEGAKNLQTRVGARQPREIAQAGCPKAQKIFKLGLDAGTCYSFIAQGTPGKVKKLWLYLWDQSGKRIIESKGESPNATIGHCAKETGMFKFQVKVHSGSGDYKLGIYAKDAAKAPKK
jgi:hypothetical protein